MDRLWKTSFLVLFAASIILLGCVSPDNSPPANGVQQPNSGYSATTVPAAAPTVPSSVFYTPNCPRGYYQCGAGCVPYASLCCNAKSGYDTGVGWSACFNASGGYCGNDTQNNCFLVNSTLQQELATCVNTSTPTAAPNATGANPIRRRPLDSPVGITDIGGGYPPVTVGGGGTGVTPTPCSSLNASAAQLQAGASKFCCVTPASQTQGSLDCPEGTGICGDHCVAMGSPCCIEDVCFPMGDTSGHYAVSASQTGSGQTGGSSGTGRSGTTGRMNNPALDSRTGCPTQGAVGLQCSGWVQWGSCTVQSCTCDYQDATGATAHAYFTTGDGQYFPCTGSGQMVSCVTEIEALVTRCGGGDPWMPQ